MQMVLREITPEDESFIYSSFLKSYHHNYPLKFIPKTLYFKQQSDIISFLLKTAHVLVAVFPEDANEIAGYIVYQYFSGSLIVHYLYVREDFWKQGIASNLIQSVQRDTKLIISTVMVDNFTSLKNHLTKLRVTYDPFLITNLRLQND